MDDWPAELSDLSPQEKRKLLEKLLRSKQITTNERAQTGFEFPAEYKALLESYAKLEKGNAIDQIYFQVSEGINTNFTQIDGRSLSNFSSCNYLGLSGDPIVSQAAKDAIDRYGTSVSASRLLSGERPLYRQLEKELAEWIGVEDAVTFVSGFGTNENVIGHMFNAGDLIVYDSHIHASVQQGAKLSGATTLPFPHNNPGALENILRRRHEEFRQILIVLEGVYSMDGDIPDLPQILDIKKRFNAVLMVDESHSVGVLGAHGRGIGEFYNIEPKEIDLWMGTLSKTFASCGGYIAGNSDVIQFLKLTAPGFVYSVGISPPNAAATLASLQLLKNEPQRVMTLQARARYFHQLAKGKGLNTGKSINSAIIPVYVKTAQIAIDLYRTLLEHNILALPIIYPAVPENAARIRFFINSTHSEEQISHAVEVVATFLSERGQLV